MNNLNIQSQQPITGKLEISFTVGGISPIDLHTLFNTFVKCILVNSGNKRINLDVSHAQFTSLVTVDEEENEREFLDARGNLVLTDEELHEAVTNGYFG